jgi:hypothetical protein
MALTTLSALSVRANPIEVPEKSVVVENAFLICTALMVEIFFVWLILRHSRRPRFFVLWLVAMHVVTYPAFLGLLSALGDLRPIYAVMVGEGLVVVVEGMIIYGICRLAAPIRSNLSQPSIYKCWVAAFVGNLSSVLAFPLLVAAFERVVPG